MTEVDITEEEINALLSIVLAQYMREPGKSIQRATLLLQLIEKLEGLLYGKEQTS